MSLKGINFEAVDWIQVAPDRNYRRNELSGSVTCEEFLDMLNDYQPLKKHWFMQLNFSLLGNITNMYLDFFHNQWTQTLTTFR
jgi:hypothetical protein